jgi:pilus assembly protein CpaE
MDLKLWKSIVTAAPSGVDVIPAVPDPPSAALGVRRIPPIFRFWRAHYDYTIVDMGHGLTQDLLDALDSLDSLVLVATNEMLALRQAKHVMHALASRNFGANRLRLVINRMPKRPQIPVAELQKVMGQPIYAVIPNDYHHLNEAYSEPRLLDPGDDLSVQIGKFAARLTGVDVAEKKRSGLFGLRRKN